MNANISSLIHDYARSWHLLQAYDENALLSQTAKQESMHAISLDQALESIEQLKEILIEKGEASELFGQLRGNGLESALATIEQGFGGESFYPNVASRAAHLLYFIIKNHPLADGNKRSGAFLFLLYLHLNAHLLARPVHELINDNTLVTVALLVAQSDPAQKDLIVNLVQNLIVLKANSDHA
ncbi:type II toxin-antitoxin system death-on-curing family toxin [Orrella sp. 11846]|uniref:type II toxin-antitoxin system death-on-curing family toxin n=1 Tax=Orrella sp. 11846 TaxID=3409913 RepID=UPI003B5BD682